MRRRDIFILAGALILALVLGGWVLASAVVETGSWGLSFQTEGQPPAAPLSAGTLEDLGAVYVGSGSEKVLYLTFDAGYENGCTAQILDTLGKHNIKAAFFLVGHYMQTNADLVRRMEAEGHTVANHSMHHPDMTKLTEAEFKAELTELEDLYRDITGGELAKFYRPPQGIYSEATLKAAKDLGYRTVFWSLAYADWDNDKQPTAQYALEKLLPRTHDGAVILLHSTSATNAAVLDELLTKWEEMGYRFGTLDALFKL
ncbi:MAG: polysaccharide deacetylase family protein [Oscillospiraceae bacterium]|nr:polysaccharide deacetylase family protein [Oscillospiraceae bacterium]